MNCETSEEDNFVPFSDLSGLSASLSSQNIAQTSQSWRSETSECRPGEQHRLPTDGSIETHGTKLQPIFLVGGVKPRVSSNAFDDLLGGFTPSDNPSQNQSIGAMKKTELVKAMDPDEAKIFQWKQGKSQNIRTLLSSIHKINWTGARWTECGMHTMSLMNTVQSAELP